MSDEVMVEEVETEATKETQEQKTFTQDELDRIVADRVAREQRKVEKKLQGVDLDKAKQLLQEQEQLELERQKERGEFDNILKEKLGKKDQEIMSMKAKLERTLVDGTLLAAASSKNAVSPEQVSQLLRGSVKLSEHGDVEILDSNGTPRYNDKGDPLSVSELVSDFLTANPHFVRASQGGAGSMGNAGGSTHKPQSVADMVNNWESGGREAYRALKTSK